ncbi:MAG: SDR family NAD(P)-dependent oxidoreductase, partial [Actinobacteria bacterium]|nr:SDR family NAD(P)-dependent oxidoreductase [Actinomycetota bacterium]MCG2802237.1 SDR family NAD(P)-dependent oxidoreductase [Cellulomonas sp.]
MDLRRTALVTGAGRGIGAAVAVHLARAGYRLALLGRTRANLEEVARRIVGDDPAALVLAVDVLDEPAVRAAIAQAEHHLGGIGLLVNNAGVIEDQEADFL